MKIAKMQEGHIKAIAEIESECFSSPWSEEGIREELSNENAHFFVAQEGEAVLGYGGMHTVLDEGYIANIAVREKHRGRKIGSEILLHLIGEGKESQLSFISLEVRKSNFPAICLYEKFGFENVGERKNFYTSPTENALIMTKYFKKEE